MLSVEWTRRPACAVVAQSALNKIKSAQIHWIDLHTGPITWQIRDRTGLLSMIELLTRIHKTANVGQHGGLPVLGQGRAPLAADRPHGQLAGAFRAGALAGVFLAGAGAGSAPCSSRPPA